jgi:hypothetical protein
MFRGLRVRDAFHRNLLNPRQRAAILRFVDSHHLGIDNVAVGVGSTTIAFIMPESLIAAGERWLYAVLVAVVSTLVSRAVSVLWEKVRKPK